MSKKYLVPYSLDKGASRKRQCIVPINDNTGTRFVSLPKGTETKFGMVALGGKELTLADYFTKVVDAGFKILPSVEDYSKDLELFKLEISNFKVGDIVKLSSLEEKKFSFEKQKNGIKPFKAKLP